MTLDCVIEVLLCLILLILFAREDHKMEQKRREELEKLMEEWKQTHRPK